MVIPERKSTLKDDKNYVVCQFVARVVSFCLWRRAVFMKKPLARVDRADGDVFVITLQNGEENRLTVELLDLISSQWDHACKQGARCIVLASESRFFSNGVDLSETAKNPDLVLEVLVKVCRQILFSGVPSIALLGHAVGGGLLLALSCDYRVSKKKGWMFVPAIELGIRLPSWLIAMCSAKLGARAAQLLLSGERISGDIGLLWGVVALVAEGNGLPETLQLASKVSRDVAKRPLHAHVKQVLFRGLEEMKSKL